MRRCALFVSIVVVLTWEVLFAAPPATAPVAADAIEGVQPAALDQPHVFICFRRGNAKAAPLQAKVAAKDDKVFKHFGIAGDADDAGPQIGAEAFLDTGATGVLLSTDTLEQLGIK